MIKYTKILKEVGFKVTPGRIAILKVFPTDCKPINAEEIFKKLKTKKLDQVTVYRTLNAFEEKGLIRRVDLRKGSVYYELNDHHHHHFVCTECAVVEHIDRCPIDEHISKKILQQSRQFSLVNQHSFEFFGICNRCINH